MASLEQIYGALDERRHRTRACRPRRRRGVTDASTSTVQVVDVSRHFGRRRALAHLAHRAPRRHRRPARPERRRQVDADQRCSRRWSRRRPARSATAASRASALGPALRTPHRPARPRAAPLSRADRAAEPDVLRRAVRPRPARAGRRRRWSGGPGRSRRRRRSAGSRAACGSGSRSSARCCTGRGWCCSTSRSPASTIARSSVVADRLRRLAAGGAIVLLATHDLDLADGLVTRVALIRDGRLLVRRAGAAPACARAIARSSGRDLTMFFRSRAGSCCGRTSRSRRRAARSSTRRCSSRSRAC